MQRVCPVPGKGRSSSRPVPSFCGKNGHRNRLVWLVGEKGLAPASLRPRGQWHKTVLFAESAILADLIGVFQFGMGGLSPATTWISNGTQGGLYRRDHDGRFENCQNPTKTDKYQGICLDPHHPAAAHQIDQSAP